MSIEIMPAGHVGAGALPWFFEGPGEGRWSAMLFDNDYIHFVYRHRGAWIENVLPREVWEIDELRAQVLGDAAECLNLCVDRGWWDLVRRVPDMKRECVGCGHMTTLGCVRCGRTLCASCASWNRRTQKHVGGEECSDVRVV